MEKEQEGSSSPWISAGSISKAGQNSSQTTPGSKVKAHTGIRFQGNFKKNTITKPFNFSPRLYFDKGKARTNSENGKNFLAGKSSQENILHGMSLTHTRVLPKDMVAEITSAPKPARTPELTRRPIRSIGGPTSVQRRPSLKRSSIASPAIRRSEIPRIAIQRSSEPDAQKTSVKESDPKPDSATLYEDVSTAANDVFYEEQVPSALSSQAPAPAPKKAPPKPPRLSVTSASNEVDLGAPEVLVKNPRHSSLSEVKEVPDEKNVNSDELATVSSPVPKKAPTKPPRPSLTSVSSEVDLDALEVLIERPKDASQLEAKEGPDEISVNFGELIAEADRLDETFLLVGSPPHDLELENFSIESPPSSSLQVLTSQSSEECEDPHVVITVSAPASVKATISINTHKAKKPPAAHTGMKFIGKVKKETKTQPFRFFSSSSKHAK